MSPGHAPRGTKAAMVVAVEMMMGKAISPIPALAASYRDRPSFSIKRYTFSTTTIPLSTSIPKPITSPKSTIVLRVYPKKDISIKDINMDIGMAKPTKRALRKPKKNIKTVTTSNTPKMMLLTKSLTWLRVMLDWSLDTATDKSEGKYFSLVVSTIRLISCEASIKFFPPLLLTSKSTAGV